MKLFSLPTALVTAGLASIALAAAPASVTAIGDAEGTSLYIAGNTELDGGVNVQGGNVNVLRGQVGVSDGRLVINRGTEFVMYSKDPVTNVETRHWLKLQNGAVQWNIDEWGNGSDRQTMAIGSNGFE